MDSAQAAPYSYNAQRILKMLWRVTASCGNLLINIGPAPDGSVTAEATEPLTEVGRWLADYGDAVYGLRDESAGVNFSICGTTRRKNHFWVWNWITNSLSYDFMGIIIIKRKTSRNKEIRYNSH